MWSLIVVRLCGKDDIKHEDDICYVRDGQYVVF